MSFIYANTTFHLYVAQYFIFSVRFIPISMRSSYILYISVLSPEGDRIFFYITGIN